MPTANFNLPIYGPTDSAALDTLLNGQSNAIDAALAANSNRLIGLDSARTSLASPKLKEGLTWYSTDTDREWFYTGSAWVSNTGGMHIIWPASTTNVTVAADGTLTPTGTPTTMDIDGIFSTRFRMYKIVYQFRLASVATGLTATLRRAGSLVNAAGSYGNQRIWSSSTTPNAATTSSTGIDMITLNQSYVSGELNLFNPALSSTPKSWNGTTSGGSSTSLGFYGGFNGDATALSAVDGIRFTVAGATFTTAESSFFKIYGMA